MNVRRTEADDVPSIQRIVAVNDMFPPDMVPGMLRDFLERADGCDDHWLTCVVDGRIAGFCYAAPEPLTDGTWNMLAIAVMPGSQRSGVGTALASAVETALRERGRVLIADTSGSDAFASARRFYAKAGFVEEARIRDFWAAGDDKVVFWKAL